MARNRNTAPAETAPETAPETAAPAGLDLAALAADVTQEAALPKATRQRTRNNPFDAHVKRSAESGTALSVPAPTTEIFDAVARAIRNAAGHFGYGIKVRHEDGRAKFQATLTRTKRVRRYTNDDIRTYHGLAKGAKLTPEHRAAFRAYFDAQQSGESTDGNGGTE